MDFSSSKLYGLSNRKYLSELLQIEKKKLNHINAEFSPYQFQSEVKGKLRTLYNPNYEHKVALKKLTYLLSKLPLPTYAFGGVKAKNYVGNAEIHKENEYFLLVDIKNFFPTTKASYVYNLFNKKFNMPTDIAKILTDLTTIPCKDEEGEYLPQGYPTSPLISLLAYIDMYEEIWLIACENNLRFTCYYDDLTLSSKNFIPESIKRRVSYVIKKYGFDVHPKKTKLTIRNYTKVTGVILNDNQLKVPKGLLKKLHDQYNELINLDKESEVHSKEEFVICCNKIQGLVAAVLSIDSEKNMEMYRNYLVHIRRKYDVPNRMKDIGKRFKSNDGESIGIRIVH